jgi:predicted nucleic acid-binding protein
MAYLLDTGILLRLANKQEPRYALIRGAVGRLVRRQEGLVISTQNVAEFCNVASRPVVNNGLGLPPADALRILALEIEPICSVLTETDAAYAELKRLIGTYSVAGKQVHDAHLAAIMLAWRIDSILTLNDRDFRRFEPEGIEVVTPASLIAD